MNSRALRYRVFLLALSCVVFIGCSESNPLGRMEITGVVTLDGTPLDSGLIEFTPEDPAGHSTGAVIAKGEYAIQAHQGAPPGKYIVRITSPTDDATEIPEEELLPPGPQGSGPQQPPPATERIPAEFNTKSDKFVDVTEEGPNQFDFEIPARRRR